MTFTKTLYLLAACILVQVANAANTEKVLNKSLSKLKAIQSASYMTSARSWEPYQKEEERAIYPRQTIEQDCPTEPYTGCRFITWYDNGDICMCYDGERRLRTFQEQQAYEIDSLFRGIKAYRVVGIPFYHTCRRIIDYALHPTDSIQLVLSESDSTYVMDLTIHAETQVEFCMAQLDPHLDKESLKFVNDPASHYVVTIDKTTMLPKEYLREMEHNCSREWVTSKPILNKHTKEPINCYQYIPKDFINIKEIIKKGTTKPQPADLIGKVAPSWELKDETGRQLSLKDYQGKPLILMFTGIGCGPCKVAIPYLNTLKQQGIEIIAIESWGNNAASVRAYRQKYDIQYTMLVGEKSALQSYNMEGSVPQFFVIDANGVIRSHYDGWATAVGEKLRHDVKL